MIVAVLLTRVICRWRWARGLRLLVTMVRHIVFCDKSIFFKLLAMRGNTGTTLCFASIVATPAVVSLCIGATKFVDTIH